MTATMTVPMTMMVPMGLIETIWVGAGRTLDQPPNRRRQGSARGVTDEEYGQIRRRLPPTVLGPLRRKLQNQEKNTPLKEDLLQVPRPPISPDKIKESTEQR